EVVDAGPFLAVADGEAVALYPHVAAAGDPGPAVPGVGGERCDEAGTGSAERVVGRGDAVRGGLGRVRRPGTVVDRAVVGDGDGHRVLVGVRGRRAVAGLLVRVDAPARETEVPVRAGHRPRGAGVAGLVDLFQPGVDVVGVGRVDGEELVVPGLDARLVPGAGQRRAGVLQLDVVGHQGPRASLYCPADSAAFSASSPSSSPAAAKARGPG